VLDRAASFRRPGPYQLQAAIAAVHAEGETDWAAVVRLYDQLARITPSPIVELNRAVAVAMADGEVHGLALLDRIDGLDDYHLLHAARADLLRRLDRRDEAAASYRRALELSPNPVERSFLERRLAEVT
jgi:RNA polymerase sigma-70 factor (ECF subfamily)